MSVPTSRFSVEIDSTNKPDALLTELLRICELTFPEVRVHRTVTSSQHVTSELLDEVRRMDTPYRTTVDIRRGEATAGYSPTID